MNSQRWSRYYRDDSYLIISHRRVRSFVFFFSRHFDSSFIDRCVAVKDCLPAPTVLCVCMCAIINTPRVKLFFFSFFVFCFFELLFLSCVILDKKDIWWITFAQLDFSAYNNSSIMGTQVDDNMHDSLAFRLGYCGAFRPAAPDYIHQQQQPTWKVKNSFVITWWRHCWLV